jgi:hypothetical protein
MREISELTDLRIRELNSQQPDRGELLVEDPPAGCAEEFVNSLIRQFANS